MGRVGDDAGGAAFLLVKLLQYFGVRLQRYVASVHFLHGIRLEYELLLIEGVVQGGVLVDLRYYGAAHLGFIAIIRFGILAKII